MRGRCADELHIGVELRRVKPRKGVWWPLWLECWTGASGSRPGDDFDACFFPKQGRGVQRSLSAAERRARREPAAGDECAGESDDGRAGRARSGAYWVAGQSA